MPTCIAWSETSLANHPSASANIFTVFRHQSLTVSRLGAAAQHWKTPTLA